MIKSFKNKLVLLLALLINTSLLHAQSFPIEGRVTNQNQQAIANVSVQLLNTHHSTMTDKNGYFKLERIANGTYTLHLSAVGYASKNASVVIDKNKSIEIQLSAESSRLDEAVVTAYKKENDPQKIAASLSVLDENTVRDNYVWTIKDITGMVPNLYSSNPGDNRNITSIRGITTSSYDPTVATYIDGVGQFNLDTYIPYLQDVERIEVLRGPQGSLYGRNAMGGVINIITKKTTNAPSGTVEVTAGNKGQQRYQLSLRSPLIKDKLFLGVSGLFNKSDGFYTNEFNDSSYDKQHTSYGNAFLRYLINDQWDMTLNYKQVANRNKGAFPVVMGKEAAFDNPFILNQNALTNMIDNSTNASLSINHYGQSINFSSQTAYQANQRYYQDPIDGDFSPLDAITVINNYGSEWNKVSAFTQEFKLSSATNSASPFNWTGGLFLFHQDNPEKQGTHYGDDAGMMGVPITNATSILTNKTMGNGFAGFAQAGYKIASNLNLLAGVRYDYEYIKHQGNEKLKLSDGNIQVVQADTSASTSFNAFTPSLSLTYDITNESNLYTSYSRGFRAGGLTPINSEDPSASPLRSFKPEYSDNIEIGSKNTFLENRLQVNVTAFYTKAYDAQVPVFIMPDAITLTENTGKMNSKGVELELNAQLFSALGAFTNFGYTHARYSDLNRKDGAGNVQLKGNRPIFTPDWTSMVGLNYTHKLPGLGNQKIQVNAYGKFLGKQFFDLDNTIEQESYALLNANVSYENRGYALILWGKNLADKKHIDYAYNFGAVHMGEPLTYGLTLRKSFTL